MACPKKVFRHAWVSRGLTAVNDVAEIAELDPEVVGAEVDALENDKSYAGHHSASAHLLPYILSDVANLPSESLPDSHLLQYDCADMFTCSNESSQFTDPFAHLHSVSSPVHVCGRGGRGAIA